MLSRLINLWNPKDNSKVTHPVNVAQDIFKGLDLTGVIDRDGFRALMDTAKQTALVMDSSQRWPYSDVAGELDRLMRTHFFQNLWTFWDSDITWEFDEKNFPLSFELSSWTWNYNDWAWEGANDSWLSPMDRLIKYGHR